MAVDNNDNDNDNYYSVVALDNGLWLERAEFRYDFIVSKLRLAIPFVIWGCTRPIRQFGSLVRPRRHRY